jgi:hypothetical protein
MSNSSILHMWKSLNGYRFFILIFLFISKQCTLYFILDAKYARAYDYACIQFTFYFYSAKCLCPILMELSIL